MKCTAIFDGDNWLSVKVVAETPQESSQLVQLAMARNAAAGKVASFSASDGGIACDITLMPRKDQFGNWVKPYSITPTK